MVFITPEGFRELTTDGLRFRQVASDGTHLCGITLDDRVYCRLLLTDGQPQQVQQPWVLRGRDVRSIAVDDGNLWAVNASFAVLVSRTRGAAQWRELPGRLRSIADAYAYTLAGIGLNDEVLVAHNSSSDVTSNPTWLKLGTQARALSLYRTYGPVRVAGLLPGGGLWFDAGGPPPLSPLDAPPLSTLSSDDRAICGTHAITQTLYCASKDAYSGWSALGSAFAQITVMANSMLVGVASNGSLWTTLLVEVASEPPAAVTLRKSEAALTGTVG
ncbi:hypothetical protein PINS_up015754 [Pythium insidiosum]|nr:hypothetical protein PINS_up015754 [Pythium insidiosum]